MRTHSNRTAKGLRKSLTLLLSSLALASGCSSLSSNSKTVEVTPPRATIPVSNFQLENVEVPPDWLTIESTIVSLGEQDLFDRIRNGFGLGDVDHPTVDREEQWFAKHPDYLDRTFRRGERYLYYIVSELEARNMPRELALLPIVESAFNPVALSKAKAAGLWQFTPRTGVQYGLKQNAYYDGRRDVVESTRAALDYLQFLANEFDGDWLLAIAAYNTGEANVGRAVARNRAKDKPIDFFSLDLHRETEAYVPKLLAMRRIVNDPQRYGLEFGELDNEPYFVKVDIGGQIDLELAADLASMSKEDFLGLNPGFKRRVTDPNGPHHLLIPVENEEKFLEKLASLPADKRVPIISYRVRKGDSLQAIARRYGMTVAELRSFNHLKSNSIRPGQELLLSSHGTVASNSIPEPESTPSSKKSSSKQKPATYTVRSGETLWGIAKTHGVDAETLAALNSIGAGGKLSVGQKLKLPGATTMASTQASQERLTYTVRRGDTLVRIARLFKVDVKQIMDWNKLGSSVLKAGQRLVLYVDDSRRLGG